MGQHHDRGRGRAAAQVVLDPGQLVVAQHAQAPGLAAQVDIDVDGAEVASARIDVDQGDEVDARGVEAVPTRAAGPLTKALPVDRNLWIEHVMLAEGTKCVVSPVAK